jgi:uncharacterized protein (DUF736 family)
MTVIGFVTLADSGVYHGHLHLFDCRAEIAILPTLAGPDHPQAPHYLVRSDGVDLGRGFSRVDADGKSHVFLTLAHPQLGPRAVEARLVADPDPFSPHGHVLVWTPQA